VKLRDDLSTGFVKALADDFEANGAAAIEAVRQTEPGAYLRLLAAIVPKAIEVQGGALDLLNDEELAAAIQALREATTCGDT
jgi:hypothetical protein